MGKFFPGEPIEIRFGIINRKLLKRKSCRSIEEPEAGILRLIEQYNLTAHPFKWTYAGVVIRGTARLVENMNENIYLKEGKKSYEKKRQGSNRFEPDF